MDEPYEGPGGQYQIVTQSQTRGVERPKATSSFFVEPKIEPKTPQEKLLAAAMRAQQNAFYRQIDEIRVVEESVDSLNLQFQEVPQVTIASESDDEKSGNEELTVIYPLHLKMRILENVGFENYQ